MIFDYLIIGGGPSAAFEAMRLSSKHKKVGVISDNWGGCMTMLGRQKLQSYIHELHIAASSCSLRSYLDHRDGIQVTGKEYGAYIHDILRALPIARIEDVAINIGKESDLFCVETQSGSIVKSSAVILATGIESRPLESWAIPACTVNCFQAYQDLNQHLLDQYLGKDLVVVGSGNSAFQLALSFSTMVRSVTILANTYKGVYPHETDDPFALRMLSQPSLDLVVKTAHDDGYGMLNAFDELSLPPVWLHICQDIAWSKKTNSLIAKVNLSDNQQKLPKLSYQHALECGRLKPKGLSLIGTPPKAQLVLPGNNLMMISAIGVKAKVPAMPWDLIDPETGFIRHQSGKTSVPGLYVAGACAAYPSVNRMCPAPVL